MLTASDAAVTIAWDRLECTPNPDTGNINCYAEVTVNVAGTLVKTFMVYVTLEGDDPVDDLASKLEDKRAEYVTP